ncbi:MAG: hypothetical protein Q8K26_04605, partial [Candidatus Gracilibacteria bacterium]|nr:hypothetical protein [Candidatus Gracilibacteria bacterium]
MNQYVFRVIDGKDQSLDDILLHQSQGGSVLRSAHVGNFNPTTLFLAQKGIPIILHEFIKGDAPIYEPAFLKIDGQKIQISEKSDLPLTHDTTLIQERVNSILGMYGERDIRPAQIHLRSLESLPGAKIQLSSEFLLGLHRLNDFLYILAKTHPHQFGNYIFEDGMILNSESMNAGDSQRFFNAERETVLNPTEMVHAVNINLHGTIQSIRHGVRKSSEGIIFRSNLYILLSTLADFYRLKGNPKKTWEVIHFSGSQMMNYMIRNKKLAEKNQQEISEMFQALRETFPQELPTDISFQLVPTEGLGAIISTCQEHLLLQEQVLQINVVLKELFIKRGIIQETINKNVRDIIANMSDTEIFNEIELAFYNVKTFPSGIRKLIYQTHAMLYNTGKIEEIRKNVVDIYSAHKQVMKESELLNEIE